MTTTERFLAEIHKATPNGEYILVQHHPNGDWSVSRKSEPVPATNQAGEVERDNSTDLAHTRGDLKPLTTQPATSQEGEEPTCERCDRGVCVNPHYEDDDRLNRPAATPTPPTLSEDLREALDERIANYSAMRDQCVEAGTDENGYALVVEALERFRTDVAALAQVKAS